MLKNFGRFFKFIKYFGTGYKGQLVKMLILAFFSSFFEFASIALVFPFILMLVNPAQMIYSPIGTYISQHMALPSNEKILIIIGCMFISMIILKNIVSLTILYWQNKIIHEWCVDVKNQMMNFFLYSPYELDIKNAKSDFIIKLTDNIDKVFEFFIFKVIILVSNTIVVAIIFSILVVILPFFTVLAIIFFTIASSVQNKFFKRWGRELADKKAALVNGEYNSILESMGHVKDIKINGCQEFFFYVYRKVSDKIIPIDEKLNLIPIIPQYVIELIFILTMVIFCIGVFQQYGTDSGNVMLSLSIVAISIYRMAPQIYKSQVCMNYMEFYKDRMDNLFEIFEEYQKHVSELQLPSHEKMSFNDNITVSNLNYSYDKTNQILKNLNFEIKKGEFVGIIGLSGAGKSTLVDCLLGLLGYEGKITVDGVELNNQNTRKFQNIIGYVAQEIHTIGGDVADNVAWGVKREKIDENKVIESLKAAQIYDILNDEKNGIYTPVRQDGTGLSQGQKQRIGIARALYRDPEIIILDEATSNLDVKIENELTQIMTDLKGKKTIIAIAHRISTLVNCDKIIYLKNGEIIDIGTFEALSEKHPDFKEIIALSRVKID